MSDYFHFLVIAVTSDHVLFRVAIKIHQDHVTRDLLLYPLQPENRKQYNSWLQEAGYEDAEVVEVTGITEILTISPTDLTADKAES